MAIEEEAQSNNIQENNVKQYKGISIRTRQNTLQDNPDWISQLPDSVLLHILSQLGIEDVVKTSLLSKRWKYLWTTIPNLNFTFLETGRKFENTTFIDRFLFHHDNSSVHKLNIGIKYEQKHVLFVDSWVQFAIRHNVGELKLDLVDGRSRLRLDYTLYKLPRSLFRCGSLTILHLCGCHLDLPATIQLNSLKKLCLEYINLDPFAVERITSNCPLLEDLFLLNCNQSTDLNICLTNGNIKNLTILEIRYCDEFDSRITTINVPNLISLQFRGHLSTTYHLRQLRSLVIVDFYYVYGQIYHDIDVLLYDDNTGCDFAKLLHDLCYVKEFRLNDWCIQALTAKKIQNLDLLSVNATCIKISTGLTKWELPGIFYLLQCASYLETFEIHCCGMPNSKLSDDFVKQYEFEEKEFWKLREIDSSSILQNTKTIKIIGFHSNIQVKDVKHWEKEIELVRFLLKTSKVLEKMTYNTCLSSRNDIDLMLEVTLKLTSFPRASPNAGLFII